LHKKGWIHRDPSPGNIIVVNDEAKLSDLEFAKERDVGELQKLTMPLTEDSPPARKEARTVRFFPAKVYEIYELR
jgi:serine/threonine protein kinase